MLKYSKIINYLKEKILAISFQISQAKLVEKVVIPAQLLTLGTL